MMRNRNSKWILLFLSLLAGHFALSMATLFGFCAFGAKTISLGLPPSNWELTLFWTHQIVGFPVSYLSANSPEFRQVAPGLLCYLAYFLSSMLWSAGLSGLWLLYGKMFPKDTRLIKYTSAPRSVLTRIH